MLPLSKRLTGPGETPRRRLEPVGFQLSRDDIIELDEKERAPAMAYGSAFLVSSRFLSKSGLSLLQYHRPIAS